VKQSIGKRFDQSRSDQRDYRRDGGDNLHDIKQYLTAVARRPEVSNQLRAHNYTEADCVRILKERSGGVWMYLFYVISEIAALVRSARIR
jgi:hypothetical protein